MRASIWGREGGCRDDPHRGRGAAGLMRACPNTGDKKRGNGDGRAADRHAECAAVQV